MNKLQLIKIALLTALLVKEVRNAKRIVNVDLKINEDELVSYINKKNAENFQKYL
ncbi:hypothetical protein K4S27_06295 [Staphylococcus epidermidis]|nr:hypothetical protein [Staphylococcus epidermidis]MCG2359256.1 hypothetical protein [Staphylococcus epidermidis]MCG2366263.1 hypothetical protein [Staphylococcus epidermidis]MCG2370730.1 hypothetical protein [Staphylococcus epidermidis]